MLAGFPAFAQQTRPSTSERRPRRREARGVQLPAELAPYAALSCLVGKVTDRSVVLSVLSREAGEFSVRSGPTRNRLTRESPRIQLNPGEVHEHPLDVQSAECHYEVKFLPKGSNSPITRGPLAIRAPRAKGSEFSFTIQGDSHPERPQMFDATLYARTLQGVAQVKGDFHVCMGDDFSISKLPQYTADSVAARYLLQRPFLGLVGESSPLFLVNGNHEQASLYNYNQTGIAHAAAVCAQVARNSLFPVPEPDHFYSGNTKPLEGIGPLRDYCAWTWGNALFVILDCYWHSPAGVDSRDNEIGAGDRSRNGRDRDWWGITIGDEQYHWFKETLEKSTATYKFVFAHHVLGTGRGGVERAHLFEWGGKNNRGADEFKQHRPNWELPIHQLMVKHGVSIFFQGHDHLFAKQELDGVIYQEVPVPADWTYSTFNDESYTSGVKYPNSGFLSVRVGVKQAEVEYVRSCLPKDETKDRKHGEVVYRYSVPPRS
jgi:hypothetical protein